MNYKNIITLYPEDLEFEIIGDLNETNKMFSFATVKRILRGNEIERINPDSVKKIMNKLVKLIKELTREGDLLSQSEGKSTIQKHHISQGSIFIDDINNIGD